MRLNANQVSKSVRELNPGLFDPLGAVQNHQPQPPTRTLVRAQPSPQGGGSRMAKSSDARTPAGPRCRVTLTAYRRGSRQLDSDNLVGGLKPLRDAIAAWLGLDDRDDTVAWEYHQVVTRGGEGVAVKLEVLTLRNLFDAATSAGTEKTGFRV
jgi:hypothetical protein